MITIPTDFPNLVAVYTVVRTGSRNEVEPGKSGYAHLFEHLMFRGTEKIPARAYDEKMQSLGSDNNAFTTDDFTFYVPLIPKESLSELFEFIPSKIVQYRVFALDHDNDRLLAQIAEAALKGVAPEVKTSV